MIGFDEWKNVQQPTEIILKNLKSGAKSQNFPSDL